MDRRRVCQLGAMSRTRFVCFLQIVLAFAEMGFNAIDERLFRTRDHEINLIKVRVMEGRGDVVAPRFLSQT